MADILLTHPPAALRNYYGARAVAALRALGYVRLNPMQRPLSTTELLDVSQGCSIIVSDRSTPGEALLFERHTTLRAFVRCAVDIRTVAVPAASANGILVTRASPGFAPAVTELILGCIIDLLRGITDGVMAYRAGRQPEIRIGRQLRGSTLGVVGFGIIGRQLCDVALALGMRVLVHDPYVTSGDPRLHRCSFEDLLAGSDTVVCLAVASAETENLFEAAAFAAMKPSAVFVNAARGELVDDAALVDALSAGQIAGAALDVGRGPDQMPSPVLAARPDVIATPHIGGLTVEATAFQAMETVDQVSAILAGRVPAGAVNADFANRLLAEVN